MNVLAIASREIEERKLLFLGAFLVGLLLLASPLLPSVEGDYLDVVTTVSFYAAVAFALGGMLASGHSLVNRDLVENRLGFYLVRPVGVWSIWFGKMIAAFALALFCGTLVLLPSTILGGGFLSFSAPVEGVVPRIAYWSPDSTGLFATLLIPTMLLLFGIAHLLGLVLRSRGVWSLIDLIVVPAIVLMFWLAVRPYWNAYAFDMVRWSLGIGLVVLIVSLIVSGGLGLARGRVQISAVHRATSLALAVLLGGFTLLFAAAAVWSRSIAATDLTKFWHDDHPAGILVSGTTPFSGDYAANFLVTRDAVHRLPPGQYPLNVSRDGSTVVWSDAKPYTTRPMAIVAGTDEINQPRVTTIRLGRWGWALSPSGERLAIVGDTSLSVIDLESDKAVMTIRVPEKTRDVEFIDENRLRLIEVRQLEQPEVASGPHSGLRLNLTLHQVDIEQRTIRPTGTLPVRSYRYDPASDLLLTRSARRYGVYRAADLHPLLSAEGDALAVLPDGEFIVAEAGTSSSRLQRFDQNGNPVGTIELPFAAHRIAVIAAPGDRQLDVWIDPGGEGSTIDRLKRSSTHRVSLDSGKVSLLGDSLMPARISWWNTAIGTNAFYVDGSNGSMRLVDLDEKGSRRAIVGK